MHLNETLPLPAIRSVRLPRPTVAVVATLLLALLSFRSFAEDRPEDLTAAEWFRASTAHQQDWLKHQVTNALEGPGPLGAHSYDVRFFSLQPELVLYRSENLEEPIFTTPAVPHAVEAGKDDWGGNLGTLRVHQAHGTRLDVTYQDRRGWIERSAVRFDSIVVCHGDGSYFYDLVPGFAAGGSRAQLALRALGTDPVLVARYIKTYRGEDARWIGFTLDPQSRTLAEVRPWPDIPGQDLVVRTLADLPLLVRERLDRALAFGAKGFARAADGKLEERERFFPSLRISRAVVEAGDFLLVDSSFYPNTAPSLPQ